MGFEFFKRNKAPKTPQQEAEDKKNRNAKIALGVTGAVLTGVLANQTGVVDLEKWKIEKKDTPRTVRGADTVNAENEQVVAGHVVTHNAEGIPTVHIPAPEIKSVDLKAAEPVSIDLRAKQVKIDLREKQ